MSYILITYYIYILHTYQQQYPPVNHEWCIQIQTGPYGCKMTCGKIYSHQKFHIGSQYWKPVLVFEYLKKRIQDDRLSFSDFTNRGQNLRSSNFAKNVFPTMFRNALIQNQTSEIIFSQQEKIFISKPKSYFRVSIFRIWFTNKKIFLLRYQYFRCLILNQGFSKHSSKNVFGKI